MTGHLQLELAKLPSIWASYPRVVLVRRPPITEVTAPPEITASVPGVMLDAGAVVRYAQMCGFGPSATLPGCLTLSSLDVGSASSAENHMQRPKTKLSSGMRWR